MRTVSIVFLMFCVLKVSAQVTFTEHIAPIMFEHCTSCHRQGEIGPMPLTNYQEVSANGGMVQYVTEIGYMPPWSPDHTYSTLRDENWLTQEEINLISEWLNNGMPEGNPDLMPSMPEYIDGSQIGEPDLVLTMSEAYQHLGTNSDQYQVFVLPTGLTEDVDIEAIEVRPDNKEICHHAILGMDTSDQADILDAQDPEYGYTQFGGFGFDPVDPFIAAWVPGSNPMLFPPTIGKKLLANSKILLQMHYGPSSINQEDQTSVNIFFSEDPVQRYVQTTAISPLNLDQAFFIPANQVKTFHGTLNVPFNVSLIGIGPHAHLLCKSYEVYAESPDGNTIIPLVKIPEWDFNWQGFYAFPNMTLIPAGYTVHCIATYDNTSNNPANPFNPPVFSSWGEGTQDEMYLCYLQFVPYLPGDENINLSAANEQNQLVYPVDQLFPSYPNPARDIMTIGFSLKASSVVDLSIYDMQGKLVHTEFYGRNLGPGLHKHQLSVQNLHAGVYVCTMSVNGVSHSRKIIVSN